jgi:hypothetical protein
MCIRRATCLLQALQQVEDREHRLEQLQQELDSSRSTACSLTQQVRRTHCRSLMRWQIVCGPSARAWWLRASRRRRRSSSSSRRMCS